MIPKGKISKSHLKMPSPIARPNDHGCPVRNGTRNMDAVGAGQSDGARNRTPANLQTNLSLKVMDGDGEIKEVGEEEAEARVGEQKD